MIKNIQSLKQFGIFQSHTNTNAKDFGKYNLFYGWNGSGKSTLSGVFRCVQSKTGSVKFPSSEFTVNIEGGAAITQANVAESELNVYTFNHDFIPRNPLIAEVCYRAGYIDSWGRGVEKITDACRPPE